MSKEVNFIPSVHSSLKVLEFLSNKKTEESTLTEISVSLSINKSTCFRILKTLEKSNFVQYDQHTKKYKLGSYLIILGTKAKEVNNHMNMIDSYLTFMSREFGHTIVLAKQVDVYNMMYISKKESESQIRLTVSTGETFPIIGGAAGKAYMAYLDKGRIDDIIDHFSHNGQLPQYTNNSVTDPTTFLEELKEIKQNRIAESDSEHTPGIFSISCPIFNSEKQVIFSVAVFIPSFHSSHIDIQNVRKTIQEYASKINNEISIYM